jgi:glyoxylase-like metal-dependent hydrolase (beta-lactamase superfamily II)
MANDPANLAYVCVTCGTQYPRAAEPPAVCPICDEPRQYIGPGGQQWTTLAELQQRHANVFSDEEPGLLGILPEPKVGIGQRAFVVRTGEGNLLWDCVALLDPATVDRLRVVGGLAGIAISHPHYYTTMIEWSQAFGNVPIYLHEDDAPWVMRPDPAVQFWRGERRELFGGLSLVRTGGHFDGFQVLHWPAGAEGRGALLCGDQPYVCQDRRWVSFMYSYPNLIPLGPAAIRRIVANLAPLRYDRLYGAFAGQLVASDAQAVVARSAERYLQAIGVEG